MTDEQDIPLVEPDAYWRYRLIQHDDCIGLHTVYYRSGQIDMYSEPIIIGNTVQDIKNVLRMMMRDTVRFSRDIISKYDLPKQVIDDDD